MRTDADYPARVRDPTIELLLSHTRHCDRHMVPEIDARRRLTLLDTALAAQKKAERKRLRGYCA